MDQARYRMLPILYADADGIIHFLENPPTIGLQYTTFDEAQADGWTFVSIIPGMAGYPNLVMKR